MLKLAVLICALVFLLAFAPGAAAQEKVERGGTVFYIFVTEPARVDLFWLDKSGARYAQFATLQKALAAEGRKVEFMMNGGIFRDYGVPSGLLVIDGKTVRPLNTASGAGNFYLKPNGVFYVDATGGHVVTTEEYAALKPSPRIAIQSGPLLLRAGRINPVFRADSTNYLHRNGVGVRKDGKLVFSITEFGQKRYANLYEFADFFRAQGCEDALFLDGDLSQMVVDPKGDIPVGNNFGAIIAVAPKKEEGK